MWGEKNLLLQAVEGDALVKASQQPKNIDLKLSTASLSLIQVFFIVLYTQYFRNNFLFWLESY